MLTEKIVTAITLGAANTRVRDYADVHTLTGQHDLTHAVMHEALHATAEFRRASLVPLSTAIDNVVELRQATYLAYRGSLRSDGDSLPDDLHVLVDAATTFARMAWPLGPHDTGYVPGWSPRRCAIIDGNGTRSCSTISAGVTCGSRRLAASASITDQTASAETSYSRTPS